MKVRPAGIEPATLSLKDISKTRVNKISLFIKLFLEMCGENGQKTTACSQINLRWQTVSKLILINLDKHSISDVCFLAKERNLVE